MPRLTEEARDARRAQILDAARACVHEHGLEAVSMEMIIAASGLSTGAVYRYFSGKGEIISAAVRAGTDGLVAALRPLIEQDDPLTLPDLVGRALHGARDYASAGEVDLAGVVLHGWSHAYADDDLRETVGAAYRSLRDQYALACKKLQASGRLDAAADPEEVAQLVLSISLGFAAQRALTGRADIDAHVRALASLMKG